MERYILIIFVGPKGAGKSSLIKSLYPDLDVAFEEPAYYRDYKVGERMYIREVAGRREAVEFLQPMKRLWRPEAGIIVIDGSKPDLPTVGRKLLSLVSGSRRMALVLNKRDMAPEETLRRAEKEARTIGAAFFSTSCVTGSGVNELKSWIESPMVSAGLPRAPRRRIVPIPGPSLPERGAKALTEFELRQVLRDEGLDDLDRRILALVDGSRTVSEISNMAGLSRYETMLRLKRLAVKGYIKELKILVS